MLSGTGRDGQRPATFRDVFASTEYRAVYAASALSWIGDSAARASRHRPRLPGHRSAAISAAAFALTYAPWLLGGSLLVALAERYPHRTVMVTCDVARVLIMAAVAVPRVPLPAVLVLVLVSAFFALPFDAARSATLPEVLTGERYLLGVAINSATNQPAQVVGYVIGAALSISHPRTRLRPQRRQLRPLRPTAPVLAVVAPSGADPHRPDRPAARDRGRVPARLRHPGAAGDRGARLRRSALRRSYPRGWARRGPPPWPTAQTGAGYRA